MIPAHRSRTHPDRQPCPAFSHPAPPSGGLIQPEDLVYQGRSACQR
jgi:hypothetical protein